MSLHFALLVMNELIDGTIDIETEEDNIDFLEQY